jgi:hypothetical protein
VAIFIQCKQPILPKEFQGNLNNGTYKLSNTITETVEPTLVELQGFNLVNNPYPFSRLAASSGWDRTKLELSGGGNDMGLESYFK